MVDVTVREHDRIDRVGRHGEVVPIPLAQMLLTLKQSAIDQHAGAAHIEQMTRTRHHTRRAKKSDAGSIVGSVVLWCHNGISE